MATTVTVYDFLSNESSTKWKGLLQSALRRVNASCMRQLCVCIYVTNTFGHIYHFVHIPPTLLWTHLSVFCYMYILAVYVSVCVCVCASLQKSWHLRYCGLQSLSLIIKAGNCGSRTICNAFFFNFLCNTFFWCNGCECTIGQLRPLPCMCKWIICFFRDYGNLRPYQLFDHWEF